MLESETVNHSVLSDSATAWTVARQVPLSMEFSRQEYWSGLSCLPSGDLPNPGIEPRSPSLQAGSLPSELCVWSIKKLRNIRMFLKGFPWWPSGQRICTPNARGMGSVSVQESGSHMPQLKDPTCCN